MVAKETRAARVKRLYAMHKESVFRWALRYGAGDVAFAEDVTHDVFVKLMRAIEGLEDDDALGPWLYRVTTRSCLSRLTRTRFRRSVLSLLGLESETALDAPFAQVEARTSLRPALKVMEKLSSKERVALTMFYLDGKSQDEIAETLGHSKGYVSKLIQRAMVKIRKEGYEVQDG